MPEVNGEYINKYLMPRLIKEVRNDDMGFMAVINNASAGAINSSGIVVHKVRNKIKVYYGRTTSFADNEIAKFAVTNDTIPWEQFTTQPFSTDKEEIRTSTIDRRSVLREDSRMEINRSWRNNAIHSLAPPDNTADEMPVIVTTGPDRGDGTGAKRMLIVDLIRLVEKLKKLNLTNMGMYYLVLCPEHLTDLTIDALGQQAFRDIHVNTRTGKPVSQYGLNFFENTETVYYDANGVKKAQGAVIDPKADRPASIGFYVPHVIKALGGVEAHYLPRSLDTRNTPPTDEMRFTGNTIAAMLYRYGQSAVISG